METKQFTTQRFVGYLFGLAGFAGSGVLACALPGAAVPISAATRVVEGVPVRVLTIDLADPSTVLTVGLAGQRSPLRPLVPPRGEATFKSLVSATKAGAVVNGAFFSLKPGRPLMGTLVSAGVLANHVAWRPVGTTFGLLAGNRAEIEGAGTAKWRRHWLSIVGGPRLLTAGHLNRQPGKEGIRDPSVLGAATRTALGVAAGGHWLYLASIGGAVSPSQEALIMKALGAWDAVNLDGGTSRALAIDGHVEVTPGRLLTNVLVVYDREHPAPPEVLTAFRAFAGVRARPQPMSFGSPPVDPGPFAAGRVTPFKVLTPGQVFDFEGWRFTGVAKPIVRNVDGWLDLRSTRGGALFTSWPSASSDYQLDWLQDVSNSSTLVHLEASRNSHGWSGLALALVAGQVPLLVRLADGRELGSWRDVGGRALGTGRHAIQVRTHGASCEIWVDGHRRVAGRRSGGGPGLGFEGPLMFTRLSGLSGVTTSTNGLRTMF